MSRRLQHRRVFPLLLAAAALLGCIESEVRVRVYENGMARVTLRNRMAKGLASMMATGESMTMEQFLATLEADYTLEGYRILESGVSREPMRTGKKLLPFEHEMLGEGYVYVTAEKMAKLTPELLTEAFQLAVEERSEIALETSRVESDRGLFASRHTVDMRVNIGQKDGGRPDPVTMAILKDFHWRMELTMPGKITETTGVRKGENTVVFEKSIAGIMRDGVKVYAVSVVEGGTFGPEGRAQRRLAEIDEKIVKVQKQVSACARSVTAQERVNENIEEFMSDADRKLVDGINDLVRLHNMERGTYPASQSALEVYAKEIGFERLPEPFEGMLVYSLEKHRVRIVR